MFYLTFFAFWIDDLESEAQNLFLTDKIIKYHQSSINVWLKIGMYEQAKSLSRETFRVKTAPFSSQAKPGQVSITLMVAGRNSY